MRIVGGRVDAGAGPMIADVGLVGVDRVLVGLDGVRVAADAHIDVPGHVHDVAGAGISPASRSAAGTARSGCTASTAWM